MTLEVLERKEKRRIICVTGNALIFDQFAEQGYCFEGLNYMNEIDNEKYKTLIKQL